MTHAHVAWHHYLARDFAGALAQALHVVRMEPDARLETLVAAARPRS